AAKDDDFRGYHPPDRKTARRGSGSAASGCNGLHEQGSIKRSGGDILRPVVRLATRHAVLVRPPVNSWQSSEIAMRWWRGHRPLERIGLPGIVPCLGARGEALDQVVEEYQLKGQHHQ